MAPWKPMEMTLPRKPLRNSSSPSERTSTPSSRTAPSGPWALRGSSRISASARLLLPLPDSPTRPSASPGSSVNDVPSTAQRRPRSVT